MHAARLVRAENLQSRMKTKASARKCTKETKLPRSELQCAGNLCSVNFSSFFLLIKI